MAVTDKQRAFIQEYILDYNATQAAIRAGYSTRTAKEQGARLLSNVNVSDELQKEVAKRSVRTGITADRVIQELARIALVNPADINNMDDSARDDTAAINGYKVRTYTDKDGIIKTETDIKLCDKIRALELLGKHIGIFTDTLNLSGGIKITMTDGTDDMAD